jgi:hypothetical protein
MAIVKEGDSRGCLAAGEVRRTYYAPPERASEEIVRRQEWQIGEAPLLAVILDNLQEIVLVLNAERQIVFANRRFREFAGTGGSGEACGLRPGEAFGCIYALAEGTPAGCGTSEFCRTCGAVNVILNSQSNGTDVQECSIIRRDHADALNLRVRTSRMMLNDDIFTLFAVENISNEKRREELERIFFHDILNTAGAVRGLADVLELAPPEKQGEFRHRISLGATRLIDEINSHRLIAAAERDELACVPVPVAAADFLREILALFDEHPSARERELVLAEGGENCVVETDRGLMSRVIVNMIRNALEATSVGGRVTVACDRDDEGVRFSVHNAGVMPPEVALQVFRRSFSTKGKGRGLGTYSMRLIGERYLKGRVFFSSEKAEGTTFVAIFPRRLGGGQKH